MNETAVYIKNLGFSYPGQQHFTLRHLDLVVNEGERFGLFGPNGAGKTTLISCMTGVLDFKEGSIHLFGEKVSGKNKSFNHLFGYVPQDLAFYPELSPEENLAFFGAWSGLNKETIRIRTKELLEVLGLSDVAKKPVEKFSGGMKRRVNLAIGVIHRPRILFLDEPTVGVDVQSRHAIIHFLTELNKQGTTLIYTSHQLSEAQSLCNKIALIDEGRIIAIDTLEHLLLIHEEIGLEGLFLKLTGKACRDSSV